MRTRSPNALGKRVPFPGRTAPSRPSSGDSARVAEGVPLAKLIKRKLLPRPELVMLSEKRSVWAERFHRLRTVLVNSEQQDEPTQVIVVTSAAPEEGKSMISMNLALSFAADKNERTLLIDADLRRPTIAGWLQPAPQLGLGEVLTELAALDHAVLNLENSPLKVLPAGRPVQQPAELLAADTTRELLQTLRARYDRIIIDTPPIVPFTDADLIGGLSDGVIIVTRAGRTAISSYEQAVEAVTSTRILGTVLNDVGFSLADTDRYFGKYADGYYDGERTQ